MEYELVVRLLTEADMEATYALEQKCFSTPWSWEGLYKDVVENRLATYVGAFVNGRQVGFGGMWQILDEGFITNICVEEEQRGKGYGRFLMASLLDLALAKGVKDMTLEVRVGNVPAIHLYQSLGFTAVGVRKGYYKNPKEDAYIMWLSLDGKPAA
ncbi:ribosomal protein S18-alanine N-acetyltransferase [Eubacteriales bacterium OttesenSCG-928-M02]|nr:ribosomal protein S18-alanine N-acetyltransferase [Eubacteriales bacterium OttesenSCG-928-M02]